ncbi:hypothetical protein [Actinokineospora xionganensis]|uniref:Uncharacterized protein n=1 Tax=Actinokineospora xionganensis TaxID=2684470 RepID=A0ABR7L8S5_9PSEU|nr:hypothetical protein [Actinokineospora xionganensis]MBC6449110.1 hypothetical protein [Actinokineospora xionganensis]
MLACAGMVIAAAVGAGGFQWWLLIPVVGSLIPFVVLQVGRFQPPAWPVAAFFAAAGQVVFGAIPGYGFAAETAERLALPLFALAWVNVFVSVPLSASAYKILLLPLIPELGSLPVELRLGARVAMGHADSITTGVTITTADVIAHARRHVPNSTGSPNQITVPLREISAVELVLLDDFQPWLALADGTMLATTAGPAVALRTRSGTFVIPSDDAHKIAEIVHRRIQVTRMQQ